MQEAIAYQCCDWSVPKPTGKRKAATRMCPWPFISDRFYTQNFLLAQIYKLLSSLNAREAWEWFRR